VKSKESFDESALRTTIGKAGYPRSQVLKGPTDG
jgi:hypothetical protein